MNLTSIYAHPNPGNGYLDTSLTLYRRDGEFTPDPIGLAASALPSEVQTAFGQIVSWLLGIAQDQQWVTTMIVLEPGGVWIDGEEVEHPAYNLVLTRRRLSDGAEKTDNIHTAALPTELREAFATVWLECEALINTP